MIKCTQCKKELDSQLFVKNGKTLNRCSNCRERSENYYKQYNKCNREQLKATSKRYRSNNLEKIRERDKKIQSELRRTENYKNKRELYNKNNKAKFAKYDRDRMANRPEYFLFNSARQRARKSNIEFSIKEKDIRALLDTTKLCPLRNIVFERGNKGPTDNSITLDRIDSNKGYTKNNIQIISHLANLVKSDLNIELFEKIVIGYRLLKVVEYLTDNETRKVIVKDRLNQIEEEKLERKSHAETRYGRIVNAERVMLERARKRAKKNKCDIDIDKNYIKSIWPIDNKCPILGEKFRLGKYIGDDYSPTLDRIDNGKGYVRGNVAIVSRKANSVKNKATQEDMELILKNWKEQLS